MIVSSTQVSNQDHAQTAHSSKDFAETMIEKLRSEFLEDVKERVEQIEQIIIEIKNHDKDSQHGILEICRHLLTINAGSRHQNLAAIETISHCFIGYFQGLTTLTPRHLDESQIYLTSLEKVLDSKQHLDEESLRVLVRSLPPRNSFEIDQVSFTDVHILLVSHERASTHFVERELHACGYHTITVGKSSDALEMILRTMPDMVICAATLDLMSGVDIACALANMPSTRNMPVAILTSYELGHSSLAGLPASVAIIQKGEAFGEGLVAALEQFQIV